MQYLKFVKKIKKSGERLCRGAVEWTRRVTSPEVADDKQNSMASLQCSTMDMDGDFLDAVFMNENRYVTNMSRNVLEETRMI